ncbi:glycosyl hydrolase [Xylaria bambusicola]|uniref:glycosyl hydrolase n=1 Tax=Xylaria bambusicola TaxID=326684 RepID=UPI0020089F9C|nr:glycosyl hydrolase [Xylaria bambusicola]KAI0515219.1 glycosyl hydrolase [Xylaria bambusicola]
MAPKLATGSPDPVPSSPGTMSALVVNEKGTSANAQCKRALFEKRWLFGVYIALGISLTLVIERHGFNIASFIRPLSGSLSPASARQWDDYSDGDYTITNKLIAAITMARIFVHSLVALVLSAITRALPFTRQMSLDYSTSEAGNPFVDGWYADPDTEFYEGKYWVFPTSSYAYDEQTYLDAFSSYDLIHWEKHENILTIADVKWATRAVWAPAPIFRDGKYYLYFGANDIQEGEPEAGVIGGIGVAVADKPEGPYVDPIGKPLIGEYHNGAQPIDQDVFIDDDGQAYIFYGGHSHCNIAKLNNDMVSIGQFDDGTSFKEITPKGYVEGSQMIKRNGKYYLMWSEGGWTGPDYSVSYAMSDSVMGPFIKLAKILEQDSAVAKGSGHNGVIHIPGTDIWYIVYHRRPLSETDGNHRVLAYDRMYFNEDGTIRAIKMLVKDNFADGQAIGWRQYGDGWSVVNERLTSSGAATAMLDTNFGDLVYDATIAVPDSHTDAGLLFRATGASGDLNGYHTRISASGSVTLEKITNGTFSVLSRGEVIIAANREYHVRVAAVASKINVFVEDMEAPKITATDDSFSSGKDGVRSSAAGVRFGSISVAKA